MTAAAGQGEVAPPLAIALGEPGLSVWDDDFFEQGSARPGKRRRRAKNP